MVLIIMRKSMKTELLPSERTHMPLPLHCPRGVRRRIDFVRERSTFRWNYYSIKNEAYIAYASPDCLRALYHAEVSTDVVGYRTRVAPLPLRVGRQQVRFAAHLEEIMSDGGVVARCFWDLLGRPNSKQSDILEGAFRYYASLGIRFHVVGAPGIEEQNALNAAEAIQTFRHTAITDADICMVKDAIGERPVAPLGEVRDLFNSPALGFAKLSAMMVRRMIAINLSQELGPTTPVRLVDHG
jgi:hypothetical protein